MSVNTCNISVIPHNPAPFLLQFLLLHTVRLDNLFSSFLLLSMFRYDIALRITYRRYYRLNKETERKDVTTVILITYNSFGYLFFSSI